MFVETICTTLVVRSVLAADECVSIPSNDSVWPRIKSNE